MEDKKSESAVPGIGKRPQQQKAGFAGTSLCGVKMKFWEKVRILAGLFDTFGAPRNQGDQQ